MNFMDQSLEFRSHFVHFPHHFSDETSKKFIINRIFELPKRCSKSLCIHILKNHISSRLIWFWSFPLFRQDFGVAMKIKKQKRFLFLKFSFLSDQGLLWSEYSVFEVCLCSPKMQVSHLSRPFRPCDNPEKFEKMYWTNIENIRWNLESRFEGCSFALARAFLPTFVVPLKQNRRWYDYAGQFRSGIGGRFWMKKY